MEEKKTQPQQPQQNNLLLSNFSYLCPGLHDNNSSDPPICEPENFNSLFLPGGNHRRILLPIFQRRYCWESGQIHKM